MNWVSNYTHRLLEYGKFIHAAVPGNPWGITNKEKDELKQLRTEYRKSSRKILTWSEYLYVSSILTNSYPSYDLVEECLLGTLEILNGNKRIQEESEEYHTIKAAKHLMNAILYDIRMLPKLGLLKNPKKWQESTLIHTKPSNAFIQAFSKKIFDSIDFMDGDFTLEELFEVLGSDTVIFSECYHQNERDKLKEHSDGEQLLLVLNYVIDVMNDLQLRSLKYCSKEELAIEFKTFCFEKKSSGVTALIPEYLREQSLDTSFPFAALNYLMSRQFHSRVILGWSKYTNKKRMDDAVMKKCLLGARKKVKESQSGYHAYCANINQAYTDEMQYRETASEHLKLSRGKNPQNITETIQKRFLENGVIIDRSIIEKNEHELRGLVSRRCTDYYIKLPIDYLDLKNHFIKINEEPITHISRSGKCWEEIREPDEKTITLRADGLPQINILNDDGQAIPLFTTPAK